MYGNILENISSPKDLKKLTNEQLKDLAQELRVQMVATTSIRGGHLASSLGAVEIIIALHRVLNCPDDRIIFDVGHQAYAHKLLTGRLENFHTLREFGGISGFPKIEESPYDSNNAGHASDSLSLALGFALARDLDNKKQTIAALIGDASFTGGMAFEALNQIGHLKSNLIIILNDNGMSISPNVGGFASYLGQLRLSRKYTNLRDRVEGAMNSSGPVGRALMGAGNAVKDSVKQLVLSENTMFFEEFGITYVGPVNGHDIEGLEAIFLRAKEIEGPVVIHTITDKGKGYEPAENHPDRFHGIGPFDIQTGKLKINKTVPTYTDVFADELVNIAKTNPDIFAITAAMSEGTGLSKFKEAFPERFLDVGIAEENAVGVGASLAMSGKIPVVAIYSTFLQRAYDQIMIDVALQKQHVIFAIDRAGLVGADGPTHHGAFDISYMRSVPNMIIMAPSTAAELQKALQAAINMQGPVAIRYPKGQAAIQETTLGDTLEENAKAPAWELGKSVQLKNGDDAAILAIGRMTNTALDVGEHLAQKGKKISVYDMRFAKPLDEKAIFQAAKTGLIYTLEDNTLSGGFGAAVLEVLADNNISVPVRRFGIPDAFIEQGSIEELFASLKLDAPSIAAQLIQDLSK